MEAEGEKEDAMSRFWFRVRIFFHFFGMVRPHECGRWWDVKDIWAITQGWRMGKHPDGTWRLS